MNRSTAAGGERTFSVDAGTLTRTAPMATTASVIPSVIALAAPQHIGVADKRRHKPVAGPAVNFHRRSELANVPLRHDGEAVGKTQSLALIVSNEDRCHAELALDFPQLHLHGCAQILVERGKWLIEQKYFRIDHQRTCQGNTLLLPARELARLAIFQTIKLDERQHVIHAAADIRLRHSTHPLWSRNPLSLRDRHVGEQCIILKHHTDLALVVGTSFINFHHRSAPRHHPG